MKVLAVDNTKFSETIIVELTKQEFHQLAQFDYGYNSSFQPKAGIVVDINKIYTRIYTILQQDNLRKDTIKLLKASAFALEGETVIKFPTLEEAKS